MNSLLFPRQIQRLGRLCLTAAASLLLLRALASNPASPEITSIRLQGTNVVVNVSVPSGLHKFTLESRSRLGAGSWIPVLVARTDGSPTNLLFTLGRSPALEVLRVRGDVTDPLPTVYYQGTNQFSGPVSTSDPSSSGGGVGLVPGNPSAGVGATASTSDTRAVVESDIWQFNGQQLLYFNQRRGLQVIDIAQPSAPVLKFTLPLPAQGQQMYLLDTNHVVLLAQDYCNNSGSENDILVVQLADQGPVIQSRLSLPGSWSDSRLVGNVLYLASQGYVEVNPSGSGVWQWVTSVSSVDLGDPANPVLRDTQQVEGYGNLVYASDDYFFVVTVASGFYYQSIVHPFDISDPTGIMAALPNISLPGAVEDKFSLNYNQGVFSAIAYDWSGGDWATTLHNFTVAGDGSAFLSSGSLQLAQGQLLHASRFDATRVYIVTANQADPLWVVDNSNPAAPAISGSVETPGWSSFIRPLGNQLVTIGVDTNLVAVSLFDVSNPAAPALLSRVNLGSEYSWSLANWDDKAFNVLPDAGLILVPYSDYDTNGYSSQIQLIDLGTNTLKLRGIISHPLQPERTAVLDNTILAISEQDLISVDASNRDLPVVTADVDLAWDVSAVIPAGDFIVQISENDPGAPELRVTSSADTETVLGSLTLTNLPVLGIASQGQYAFIVQGARFEFFFPIYLTGPQFDFYTNGYPLVLSVIDLSQLPAISVAGQTGMTSSNLFWGSSFQPHWINTNVLVWSGNRQIFFPWGLAGPSTVFPYYWSPGSTLLAYDVSSPAAPTLASTLEIATNGWGYGNTFSSGDLLYTSYESSEEIVVTNWPTSGGTNSPIIPGWPWNYPTTLPFSYWISLNTLQVIDYTDPVNPTLRPPVGISNPLTGISPDGNILYTQGGHPDPTNYFDWSKIYIDASAYDGVSAHLIDSISLPNTWPQATLIAGTNVLIAHVDNPADTNSPPVNLLDTWNLSPSGKFVLANSLAVSQALYTLANFDSDLVLGQTTSSSLQVFDLSKAPTVQELETSAINTCLWFDLTTVSGTRTNGLWIPLGYYGAEKVTISP